MKHTLRRYTSAEEIFNRVSSSLKQYVDSDLIIFDEYYKTLELCNSVLGLRLNPKKQAFVKIDGYVGELPFDFLLLDLALLVGKTITVHQFPTKNTETLTYECPTADEVLANPCTNFALDCTRKPVIVCENESVKMTFEDVYYVRLTEKKYASDDCFNLYNNSPYMMEIRDGKIYTDGIENGYVFIMYTASMVDNKIPVCLDHPIVMEYYEQAVKFEILKDLLINKRMDLSQTVSLVQKDFLTAKNAAISLATTPEFHEYISLNNAIKRIFRRKNYFIY